jgi:hypothetical protein
VHVRGSPTRRSLPHLEEKWTFKPAETKVLLALRVPFLPSNLSILRFRIFRYLVISAPFLLNFRGGFLDLKFQRSVWRDGASLTLPKGHRNMNGGGSWEPRRLGATFPTQFLQVCIEFVTRVAAILPVQFPLPFPT